MRLCLVLIAALAVAGVAHAGSKKVKDWQAVCNNIASCTAFGFEGDEDGPDQGYVRLDRAGGPNGQPRISIVFDPWDTQPDQTWTLEVNSAPAPGVGPVKAKGSDDGARAVLPASATAPLIAALRSGNDLEVYNGKTLVATISLSGSAAIFLWMDVQQGRVGTVTALGKPGDGPASAVPPVPATPVILVAGPMSQAGLPKHAPQRLTKSNADCALDPGTKPSDTEDVVARLAPGIVLWGPECYMAAYNDSNLFFIGDEHGRGMRLLKLPAPAGEKPESELVNAGYDPKTRTLSEFDKGRGIADCGESAEWVWDGKQFQLLDEQVMSDCRGVPSDEWPSLYVARRR